jgi:beta-lactamase regulating signal transducer with metallopeptidase domain
MINNVINRTAVKNYADEIIKEKRPHISRIAPSFLDKINKQTKICIENLILEFKENQKTIR